MTAAAGDADGAPDALGGGWEAPVRDGLAARDSEAGEALIVDVDGF